MSYKNISTNKKAYYDYTVLTTFEAGIILQGTEVKSLRDNKCNLQDSFCIFVNKNNNDLYVNNMHVSEFKFGNKNNHIPKRPRKLLLHKSELIRIRTKMNEKGLSLIPLKIYFSNNLVKLEIGLAKPKKKYDKREAEKKKTSQKEIKNLNI